VFDVCVSWRQVCQCVQNVNCAYTSPPSALLLTLPQPQKSHVHQQQQSVLAAFSQGKPSEFNDPRSLRLTRLIAEMIAVGDQPFGVVCDDGFRRLVHALEPCYTLPSDTYMRKTAVPELYKLVRDTVHKVVSKVQSMRLTTDTWTSESLISVTDHWIDASWQRQSAVLQTSHLPGSHTAANIKEKILSDQ